MSWDQIEIKWSEMVARVQTKSPDNRPYRQVPDSDKPAETSRPVATASASA